MNVQVMWEDISPEEITAESGWKIAGERQSRPRHRATDSAPVVDARPNRPGTDRKATKLKNVKGQIIKAGRMPLLPKEETKIVVRPQGGLDIARVGAPTVTAAIFAAAGITGEDSMEDTVCPNPEQNIVVISTSKRANADRYTKIRQIYIQGKQHEVNANETAPHNTNKGVIRSIPVEEGPRELDEKIVNPRNPLALAAKCIGNTTTVIVAFDGLKVPNYVRYGATLAPCSLYRKQIDVCYQCGRLGHRKDVCPNPTNRICLGCGLSIPEPDHQCTPKCSLCGGAHLTADKVCRARYKTPYVVRKRQWERHKANGQLSQQDFPPLRQGSAKSRSPSRDRSLSHSGSRKHSSAASRSGSKTSPPEDKVRWANTVWGAARGTGRAPKAPEQTQAIDHGVVEALRKENAVMPELVQKLMQEMRELRRERAAADQPKQNEQPPAPANAPIADAPAPKKRAIEPQQEGGPEGQVQAEFRDIKSMLCSMQSSIEALRATVAELASRTTYLERNVQMTMSRPVFAQNRQAPLNNSQGPSRHQGQPDNFSPESTWPAVIQG
ncbi:uncharacterized protein LOC121048514 [Ixodes scapularis]|uniref:uncharacterized protein LOC121048514 n=1 Tax=Ixodes scapularis TaxID=6945 RepID=UPI001AD6BE8D|nr:uncharacterized protein LOC121048514 [Ixodes scapularis]